MSQTTLLCQAKVSIIVWWNINTRRKVPSLFDETQMKHKLTSSHPPNVVDTIFLGYFSIRGLLFRTISCHPHWNQRKFEKDFFFKLPFPHDLQIFSTNRGGGGPKFFLKLRQSLNFSPISKPIAVNCSKEQSPYRKKYIYTVVSVKFGLVGFLLSLNFRIFWILRVILIY